MKRDQRFDSSEASAINNYYYHSRTLNIIIRAIEPYSYNNNRVIRLTLTMYMCILIHR